MSKRRTGTVKWWNDAKGIGYIVRKDAPDLFVHFSAIVMEGFKGLVEGERVEFEVVDGPKGEQAGHVVVLAPPEGQTSTATSVPVEDIDRLEELLEEVRAMVSRLAGDLAVERAKRGEKDDG